MADFAEDDVDETPTAIGPLGVVTPKKPQMDFATRRNSVLAQARHQRGEIAVARHQAETVDAPTGQQVHRVDRQLHVGGILAIGQVELLLRLDCLRDR